jgi:hypothetical protein
MIRNECRGTRNVFGGGVGMGVKSFGRTTEIELGAYDGGGGGGDDEDDDDDDDEGDDGRYYYLDEAAR